MAYDYDCHEHNFTYLFKSCFNIISRFIRPTWRIVGWGRSTTGGGGGGGLVVNILNATVEIICSTCLLWLCFATVPRPSGPQTGKASFQTFAQSGVLACFQAHSVLFIWTFFLVLRCQHICISVWRCFYGLPWNVGIPENSKWNRHPNHRCISFVLYFFCSVFTSVLEPLSTIPDIQTFDPCGRPRWYLVLRPNRLSSISASPESLICGRLRCKSSLKSSRMKEAHSTPDFW